VELKRPGFKIAVEARENTVEGRLGGIITLYRAGKRDSRLAATPCTRVPPSDLSIFQSSAACKRRDLCSCGHTANLVERKCTNAELSARKVSHASSPYQQRPWPLQSPDLHNDASSSPAVFHNSLYSGTRQVL
jgi:hypothetical protein